MASPVSDDAMGLSQRDLLMEMREDIKALKATVDAIARDQALGVERRAAMQRSADSIYERLDGHDRDLNRMQASGRGGRHSPRRPTFRSGCASRSRPSRASGCGAREATVKHHRASPRSGVRGHDDGAMVWTLAPRLREPSEPGGLSAVDGTGGQG